MENLKWPIADKKYLIEEKIKYSCSIKWKKKEMS